MKSIRGLVEELFRNLDLDRIPPRRRALEHWDRIAGERLVDYCDPPTIDGDSVVVRVHNPAAAMQLKYRSSEIISALNIEAGTEVFSSLRVLVRPGSEKKG